MTNLLPLDRVLREACVETLAEAIKAVQLGADRLELCARLDLGGTTPDLRLVREVLSRVNIPVKVMIRPRGGNFIYDRREAMQMESDILALRDTGVRGFVFGAITAEGLPDLLLTQRLAEIASPIPVCFHKAIDETMDPLSATIQLRSLGVIKSILSSGGAATALEGQSVLRQMIAAAGDDLTIIAAGKISDLNLGEVHNTLAAREYHGRRIVGDLAEI